MALKLEQIEAAVAEAKKVANQAEANEEDLRKSTNGNDPDTKDDKVEVKDDEMSEKVDFKVVFNKKKYDISFPIDADVAALKVHLHPIIDIPPAMMKVMFKGLAKDKSSLRSLGVTKGSKVMVVGSSLQDVLSVTATPSAASSLIGDENGRNSVSQASSSKEKMHKKVLDKGKPEDAMQGIRSKKEDLPSVPLSGMLNKHGGKVRLTFKMELDQVWIGTKERTEKVPLNSIRRVVSEPIENHEEYHILSLQIGPTQASCYWIYWVPAQYVEAIKEAIMGKWAKW